MLQAPASYKLYWIMPTNNVGSQTRRDLRLQSEILIGSPYVRMDQSCEATSPQAMKQCDCAEILTLACVKARRLAQACLGGGLVRPAFPFITRLAVNSVPPFSSTIQQSGAQLKRSWCRYCCYPD
jgi:hypothetical protein